MLGPPDTTDFVSDVLSLQKRGSHPFLHYDYTVISLALQWLKPQKGRFLPAVQDFAALWTPFGQIPP